MNSTQVAFPFRRKKAKSLPVTLLFFLWPFALLLTSLRSFRDPLAKRGFILFCVYYGFVFIFSRDLQGADSARYAQTLADLHGLTPSFGTLWKSLYTYETSLLDLYQPVITWLVSIFTDNAHFLFAFFALVFGYFYANNLWIIFSNVKGKLNLTLILFILVFALLIPVWMINGVRMWTAAQVFIYGVLLFYLKNNKSGFWWATGSVLIHFSFLFPLVLLFIFRFLPKSQMFYLIFFVSTLFISELDLISVQTNLRILPEIFHPRVETYTNLEYAEEIKKSNLENAWYVQFYGIALKTAIISLLLTTIYGGRKFLKANRQLYNYLSFTLFFYGWANLISLIPSGARFHTVAGAFSLVFIILYFINYRINMPIQIVRVLVFPLLVFYCVFSIRVGFDFTGISTFIGNPLIALLYEDGKPIIEFIKSLL